jgi:uncharacterized cupin superfamily protein
VAERFTIKHWDDFERMGRWSLARRSLGVNAFGLNVVQIEPGDRLTEHDEVERDQEEVFIVLDGDAKVVVDGEDHPAPVGTFARLDPRPARTVVNAGSRPVRLLIISAPTTSGYQPLDWS